MNKAETVLAFAYGHVVAEFRLPSFLVFLLVRIRPSSNQYHNHKY